MTEQQQPKKRGLDSELQAVAKIDRILAAVQPATAQRILRYLLDKTYARTELCNFTQEDNQ